MVIVKCGEEACVNLILPAVETCARDGVHAILAKAKELNFADRHLEIAANIMAKVANLAPEVVANESRMRLAELKEYKDIDGANNYRSAADLLSRLKPIAKAEKSD
jgi:hypothetical protein